MKKHKDKALEDACLCSKCSHRFECFTQERVFSDPIFQGLFEALMANGMTKEEALDDVTQEIKSRIGHIPRYEDKVDWMPCNTWDTFTLDTTGLPVKYTTTNGKKWVTYDTVSSNVTYYMSNGKEVSWNASKKD